MRMFNLSLAASVAFAADAEGSIPNDTRLADGIKMIRELGRDAALGKDSLPKLAFQVTKMAAEGVIDTEKKYQETLPDGGHRSYDDAEYLFSEYAKAEGKKAIHERSGGGLKANISKVRQFVTFGMMTTCDPQSVLERAVAVRKVMNDAGTKTKSAYAAYVDVARNQISADSDLTDEQLEGIIRKPEPASPELEKVLRGVHKKLEELISGEGKHGLKDDSDHITTAFQAVRDRLAEIDAANNVEDTAAAVALMSASDKAKLLAALGYQQN